MTELVLGPLLRFAGKTEATVWLETSGSCEVEILGQRSRTFCVAGHHYALVVLEDLQGNAGHPYSVKLDGETVWPLDGERKGLIRTTDEAGRLNLAFKTSPDDWRRPVLRPSVDYEVVNGGAG